MFCSTERQSAESGAERRSISMETLINSTLPKFRAQAYHNDDFISVTDEDLKGKWSILFFKYSAPGPQEWFA